MGDLEETSLKNMADAYRTKRGLQDANGLLKMPALCRGDR